MSIDQRLRAGLRSADAGDAIDPARYADGWDDVVSRAATLQARDRARRMVGVAAAVVLLGAAAVVTWPRSSSEGPTGPLTPTPTTSASSATPLDGTWDTGPAKASALVSQLTAVGLGQWGDAVLEGTSPGSTIDYRLKLQGGRLTLTKAVDGAPAAVQDVQGYRVDGDRVTFLPDASSCSSVFRWALAGDRLTLRLVSDSCPDYRGVPDTAYMQALYGALAYTRTS